VEKWCYSFSFSPTRYGVSHPRQRPQKRDAGFLFLTYALWRISPGPRLTYSAGL